jgi:hypothetical protein
MTNAFQCDECAAIADEFRDAIGEMPPNLLDRYRAERDAFRKMIGGTDEDFERAEEILGKPKFPINGSGLFDALGGRYPKIQNALRKMIVHRFRTGHKAVNCFNL